MHSTDRDLFSLLVDDESSAKLQAIASHVETCPLCQSRLHKLSGAGLWTEEFTAHLRASDGIALDQTDDLSLTIVEAQSGDSGNPEIETDPIRLDFLGQPVHPELLGRLGRYDIERVIGAGGMGIVLKGYDSELHRAVAVKVLAPHLAHSAAARRRFAREAQATAAIIHPNVIPIYNVESEGKVPYLVMRYINGQSLQARVDQHGPLEVVDALRIAQQTAAGLAAAHAQGLIHRDVKPANILLDEGIERVVLSDFGLARMVDDASLTHTGIVTGTPHYMSPEQAGGDAIDCRSDLFSLGCVLWFMLAGRPPFRAATAMGVLKRICHDSHHDIREINHSVPIPLARIIDRLLAKNPDQRTASAVVIEQELLEVTRAIQEGQLSLYQGKDASRAIKRRWPGVMKIAACLVCALLVAVALWNGGLLGGRLHDDHRPDGSSVRGDTVAQPAQPQLPAPNSTGALSIPTFPQEPPLIGSVFNRERDDQWVKTAELLQSGLQSLATEDRETFLWAHVRVRGPAPDPLEQLSRELDILARQLSWPEIQRANLPAEPPQNADTLSVP